MPDLARRPMPLALALALVLAALSPSLTLSATTVRNGKIAFDRADDIWKMNPGGGDQKNLTTQIGQAHGASWSPDAAKIAFYATGTSSGTDIFVMKFDGRGVTNLTRGLAGSGAASPDWSPDGRYIVFTSQVTVGPGQSSYDLFTMRADGTEITNITNSYPQNELEPAWSSLGRIAFYRTGGLWTMAPDGSDQTNLQINGFDPTWSPDGRRLAYAGIGPQGPTSDTDWDIFVANADGSSPVNLTRTPGRDLEPTWSPDGKLIAFSSTRFDPALYCDGSECNYEILTMRIDGSRQTRVTNNPAADRFPDWARNR